MGIDKLLGNSSVTEGLKNRGRLPHLDGLRGLASLIVVLHHVWQYGIGSDVRLAPVWLHYTFGWLQFGHYAVGVFIVLSGYCLMMPTVQSSYGELQGGVRGYVVRRARRILPPYYAALVFSCLLILIAPPLRHPPKGLWADIAVPAFKPAVLTTHLLLLHNLYKDWIWKINSPMWSVAMEWQIYFIFALGLLPLWRRFGPAVVVLTVGLLTAAPYLLHPTLHHFERTSPWFVTLFTFGMVGAVISFAPEVRMENLRRRIPWATSSMLLFILAATEIYLTDRVHIPFPASEVLADLIFGCATVCLLVSCSQLKCLQLKCLQLKQEAASKQFSLLRALETRWLVGIGLFSYSLYLIHYPLIALAANGPLYQTAPAMKFAALALCATPLCVCVAYLFHCVFERPFMKSR